MWEAASTVYANRFALLSMAAYANFQNTSDLIEESEHYKGRKKYLLNRCNLLFDNYWKKQKQYQAERWPLYLDYANSCYKLIEDSVRIFFYCTKSALDKIRKPNSEFIAQILITQELIRVCADFHEDYWRIAAERTGFTDIEFGYRYSDYRPILNVYNDLLNEVVNNDMAILTVLDYDEKCRSALKAILRKAEDDRNLGKAGLEALKMNAEYNEEYAATLKVFDERCKEIEKKAVEVKERKEAEKKRVGEEKKKAERESVIDRLSQKYKVISKNK